MKIKLSQLNGKILKCVFIGYFEGGKGYKLCKVVPKGQKYIISRYVIFGETHERVKSKDLEVKELEIMRILCFR